MAWRLIIKRLGVSLRLFGCPRDQCNMKDWDKVKKTGDLQSLNRPALSPHPPSTFFCALVCSRCLRVLCRGVERVIALCRAFDARLVPKPDFGALAGD